MLKSEMGFTLHQLLYEISYQNIIMLSSAIPAYKFDGDKNSRKKAKKERINGDDLRNRDRINRELDLLG